MKLVGKIYINGTFKILFDEKAKMNPYRIVAYKWFNGKQHQTTVAKYADLKSCLYDLYASI